jgi:diguanylate cyclase (GGDEF)-like protein
MFRRLKQNEHTLRHLSTHDALTGLYNRLYFEEELARLEPSRQFPVSIVVSDLDDLKRVNDTQGHAAGDALLKHAARILKQAFRAEDIVARIGGDEFAVILPNADAEVARYAIDRIHSASLENPLPPPSPPLTMSVGMCTADKGDSLYNTLKTADMEMYKNKAAKRNQRERKVDVK